MHTLELRSERNSFVKESVRAGGPTGCDTSLKEPSLNVKVKDKG